MHLPNASMIRHGAEYSAAIKLGMHAGIEYARLPAAHSGVHQPMHDPGTDLLSTP